MGKERIIKGVSTIWKELVPRPSRLALQNTNSASAFVPIRLAVLDCWSLLRTTRCWRPIPGDLCDILPMTGVKSTLLHQNRNTVSILPPSQLSFLHKMLWRHFLQVLNKTEHKNLTSFTEHSDMLENLFHLEMRWKHSNSWLIKNLLKILFGLK